jgi:hypothetical protein
MTFSERRLKVADFMGKSKGPRNKSSKKQPQTQKAITPVKAKREWFRQAWAMILTIATLIGAPAAVVAFWPRMTVTAVGLHDESNAYSETFTIANIGFLQFKEVKVGIRLCNIETANNDVGMIPKGCPEGGPRMLLGGPSWRTPELRRDEPFSIILSDELNMATDKYRAEHPTTIWSAKMMSALKAANVILVVFFRPWPMWFEIERDFRFVAEEQSDGKMMWRAVPLSWEKVDLPPWPSPTPAK